jgi:hypothetical protein
MEWLLVEPFNDAIDIAELVEAVIVFSCISNSTRFIICSIWPWIKTIGQQLVVVKVQVIGLVDWMLPDVFPIPICQAVQICAKWSCLLHWVLMSCTT